MRENKNGIKLSFYKTESYHFYRIFKTIGGKLILLFAEDGMILFKRVILYNVSILLEFQMGELFTRWRVIPCRVLSRHYRAVVHHNLF